MGQKHAVVPERIWKWGGVTGPERKWGAPVRRKAPEFFAGGGRAPPLFLALKVQLLVSVSAFVMVRLSVQFGRFLVCCSSTHGAPCFQPFVKLGARAPVPCGVGATGNMGNDCRQMGETSGSPRTKSKGNLLHQMEIFRNKRICRWTILAEWHWRDHQT